MQLDEYVEQLRSQLLAAAQLSTEDERQIAARLLGSLESATRLVLLEALTAAADEITRELAPGSVEVRLRGVQPDFVVNVESPGNVPDPIEGTSPIDPTIADTDESAISRTTLRLPEHLKLRVEAAAAQQGLSVNAWLVRAITGGLEAGNQGPPNPPTTVGQRFTGWVH